MAAARRARLAAMDDTAGVNQRLRIGSRVRIVPRSQRGQRAAYAGLIGTVTGFSGALGRQDRPYVVAFDHPPRPDEYAAWFGADEADELEAVPEGTEEAEAD